MVKTLFLAILFTKKYESKQCIMKDPSWQVAAFIIQKLLSDDVGLEYICHTRDRFFALDRVLRNILAAIADKPSSRLLKHIINCYLRLTNNARLLLI